MISANSKGEETRRVLIPMGKRWFVYGHTEIDSEGKKSPIYPIRKQIKNWRTRSHIQTVMTAEDRSELFYGIALDLDFEKAADEWKSRGKLDPKKMRAFLAASYPVLNRYLCTWTRSTGGKGLGVILFIDPFLLRHEKTGSVRFKAEQVQRILQKVLNSHGFGCDEDASGLLRFTPNWRNRRKLLHIDDITIRRVQRDNEPHNVLTQVFNELRRAPMFKGPTRKDLVKSGVRFAVKDKADEGLSKLYAHILDSNPEALILQSSFEELSKLCGLSIPTLRSHIFESSWLDAEPVFGEGLRLTLKPSPQLSERAISGVRPQQFKPRLISSAEDWELPLPESVQPGERNNYLWRRAVILRNEGQSLEDAVSILKAEVSRIPGAEKSRNCRKLESIASSIYRHVRLPRNTKRKIFTIEALAKPQSYCPNSDDLAKPYEASRQEEACANQGEKQNQMVMVSSSGNQEEKKISESRGPGDLPPTNSKDQEVHAWMNSFLPKKSTNKHESPRENGNVINIEAFKNRGRTDEVKAPKAKVFKTLKEARAAVRRDVEPIARFERAISRVQDRASIDEVMAVLWREHQRLCATKDRCGRYTPPEGKFKRLCKAWSYFGPIFRKDFLDA